MITILWPLNGVYLSIDEVVSRVNIEFGFVQCDQQRGLRYAAERLMRSSHGLSHDEKDRQMAFVADTVEMILGDDRRHDKHFLKCFVIPQAPIEVVYLYDSHEECTMHLLTRLAKVLKYETRRE